MVFEQWLKSRTGGGGWACSGNDRCVGAMTIENGFRIETRNDVIKTTNTIRTTDRKPVMNNTVRRLFAAPSESFWCLKTIMRISEAIKGWKRTA